MTRSPTFHAPSQARLLAIIALQNEIVTAPLDLGRVMQLVAQRAQSLTVANGAAVELVDGSDMVYAAVSGSLDALEGFRLARSTSMSGLCVASRAAMYSRDTATDVRVDRAACARVGAASMICVPLFHGVDTIGVLKVTSSRTRAFSQDDATVLDLLAGLVAAAMAHARQFEEALHASTHDALTQLPNRRAFEHRLATELERHRRYDEPVTLVMLDLDGFKRANDTLGHAAGDAVLRAVGLLLRGHLRTLDAAYRLGGDEFAIILPRTTEDAAAIPIERCMAAIAAAGLADGMVGVSHGLATAAGDDAASLCARADERLYEVKRAKKASR